MPEILARGPDGHLYRVLVDPLDFFAVRGYHWHLTAGGHVYRNRSYRKPGGWVCRRVYLHRQLMGLEHGHDLVVDHLNGNPQDNRRRNLEVVTQAENVRRAQGVRGVRLSA